MADAADNVPAADEQAPRVVPGQPSEDGIDAQDKGPDSDATTTSPGAWTVLAVPGKPDGEVDTRPR